LSVQGKIGVIGAPVRLQAGQRTQVESGQFPAAPVPIDDEELAALRKKLRVTGTGGRDGLAVGHPLVSGALLRPEDTPQAIAPVQAVSGSYLSPDHAPFERLAEQLSPDLRVHTQPIPEYLTRPPGGRPQAGKVRVEF